MNNQGKTKEELLVELNELRQKYAAAEERHQKEISEIRQREEELKRNEIFLKSALDNLPLIFYLIDKEGTFRLSIGSGLNSLGLKSHQVEGLSAYEIYKEHPVITESIRKAFHGENVYFESNVNGAKHDNFLIPIHEDSVNPSAIAGIAFDVTRHKRTEDELKFSTELISLYIQNSPIYTFIKEVSREESRVIMASENYREMIGISGSEMKGKNMFELFPEEFAAKMTADDWDVVSKGKLLVLDEDFNDRHYTTIKYPIAHKGRNLLAGYTIDITEHRSAESKLKESRQRYKGIFENAMIGIYRTTPDGKILLANPALVKMLGYDSEEELLERNLEETGFELSHTRNEFKKVIKKEGKISEHESAWKRKDGTTIHIMESAIANYDSNGNILFYEGIAQDITEQRQAEEALLESEEKYKELVENSNSIILKVDRQGRITFFNEYAQKFFGYTEKEVLGSTQLKNIVSQTETTGRDLNKMMNEIYADPDKFSENINENVKKNGERVWIAWQNKSIRDKDGSSLGHIAIGRDITERRKAIEKLHENEERFRKTFEEGPIGMVIVDSEWRFLKTNNAFVEMTGYSEHELNTLTFNEITHPDHIESDIENIGKLFRGEIPVYRTEKRYIRKDGTIIWGSLTSSVVRDVNGNFMYFLSMVEDITKRKLTEIELREKELQYQNLADSGLALIWKSGPDGLCNYFNQPWLNFTGRTIEQELGNGWIEGIHPSDRENCIKACKYCLDNRSIFDVEFRLRHFSGEYYWFRNIGKSNYNSLGEFIGYIGYCFDVTERKQAEQALTESLELNTSILRALPFGMDIVDEEGNILFISDQLRKNITGDISGRKCWEIYRDDKIQCWDCPLRMGIKIGKTEVYESRGILGGRTFQISHSGMEFQGRKALLEIFQDVTEHRRSETALKESEEIFRKLFEDHSAIQLLINPQTGELIDANESAAAFYGWSREELKKMKIWQINTLSVVEAKQQVMNVVRQKKIRFEFKHRLKNGSIRDVEVFSSNIMTGDRNMLYSIVHDITERKLAEIALTESEEKYRKMVDHSPDGIIIHAEGKIVFANPAAVHLIRAENTDQFIGRKAIDFVHPDYRKGALERIKNIYHTGKSAGSTEEKFITLNKETIDVEVIGIPIVYAGRTAIQTIVRDITSRKNAENAIRQSEAKFQSIFYDHSAVKFLIDPRNGNILDANKAAGKFYGWTVDELKRMNIGQLAHATQKSVRLKLQEILANQQLHFEVSHTLKDGSVREVEVFTGKIDIEGEHFLHSIIHDITERKKAEKELIKAKEKAEESDRLKSAFLSNMSHEIRTPMNGIIGFAELLKEENISREERVDYINMINQSGERMLNLINNIVNLSKIESGQMQISLTNVNVNEQIDYICNFFKPEAGAKGINLSGRKELPDEYAIISTDKEKVYSVLTNLVKNAIKFTSVGSIELGYKKKGGFLEFFVKDTGTGIRPEHLEIIFERFRQADESLKRNYEGAGLGLSISKAYVEMLGGKIRAESKPGKGSAFYFTLPYQVKKKEDHQQKQVLPKAEVTAYLKKLKILIVEDDVLSAILLSRIFEKYGWESIIAKSGTEAVIHCHNHPGIDLILMDIQLPGIDGYEATRRIRQFNKSTVIIAQTAFALSTERNKAIKAGCDDYISKPIKKAFLIKLIKKYFDKEEGVKQAIKE